MRRSTTSNDGWFWTNLRIYTPFRALAVGIAAATLTVGCGREAALSLEVDELRYFLPSRDGKPIEESGPDAKLSIAAYKLKPLINKQATRNLTMKETALATSLGAEIRSQFAALDEQFRADRVKLEGLGAKAALKRLDQVERSTVAGAERLTAALDSVPDDGSKASSASLAANREINRVFPSVDEQPLSTNLAFGARNADPGPASLSAGITPAYLAPTQLGQSSSLPRTPEAADLEHSGETKLTPEIRKLADGLGGDPVRMFRYVRNEIRFEPYLGVRKGAATTLHEKSGSDADQAALLIALLRASDIHARFVHGTAELGAAQTANWLGVNTSVGQRPEAAAEILASGGIPTTQIRVDGELSRVRFGHYWLEAYVPVDAYRGIGEGQGGRAWVPLDPSIKPLKLTAPRLDIKRDFATPEILQWRDDFVDAGHEVGGSDAFVASTEGLEARMESLQDLVSDKILDVGFDDDDTLGDAIGSDEIVRSELAYLPSSLPFLAKAVHSEAREIEQGAQARVTFEVRGSNPLRTPAIDPEAENDGFSFTAPTTELAGKRITLAYSPASEQDAEVIDAYHGVFSTPAYGASLIPVLRVDGKVVARGSKPVPMAYLQRFRLIYRSPGFGADTVENPVEVGSLQAITLNVGNKGQADIDARVDRIKSLQVGTSFENLLTDARIGEMLALAGDLYFVQNDNLNEILSRGHSVDARRALSGAIVGADIVTRTVGGYPISTRLGTATVDVDQDIQTVVPLDNGDGATDEYLRASGTNASISESQTLRFLFYNKAVSTSEILGEAAKQEIPIYTLDAGNFARAEPQVQQPAGVMNQIRVAVEDGATVIVPQKPVTIGGWTGTGYIVSQEGSQDYRISGGASGAAFGLPIDIDISMPDYSLWNWPIPSNPLDWSSWAVWALGWTDIDERINLGCIGGALTLGGAVIAPAALGTLFATVAAVTGIAASLIYPPLGPMVATLVYHFLWINLIWATFNDVGNCVFNGPVI